MHHIVDDYVLYDRFPCGCVPQEDEFGSELLAAGLAEETIQKWSLDPQVKGKSLFDSLEDMDSLDCINKAVELNK